jgi:hypothetical protein
MVIKLAEYLRVSQINKLNPEAYFIIIQNMRLYINYNNSKFTAVDGFD